MDFFHTNIKRGSTDLKGYDLPKSVHKANSKNGLNTLDQTAVRARGKSKFIGLENLRKFGI